MFRRAFTMVEMLVTMAIMIVLMLFINSIFSNVQQAVGIGNGLSSIIESSRAINEQLVWDAEAMLPPSSNGVLVIINQKASVKVTEEDTAVQDRRVDQIMFMKTTSAPEPMVPSSNNSFSPPNGGASTVVKVCYGHGVYTTTSGLSYGAGDKPGAVGRPHEFASNWFLTRHAMYFVDDPTYGHANGGKYNSPTTGVGGEAPAGAQFMYMATADVAEFGFDTEEDQNGSMIGGLSPATGVNAADKLMTDLADSEYARRAYLYTFANERLRANLTPSNNYQSWEIAQMHPVLAEHVVDFSISFAGDYDGDGVVDTHVGGTFANAIKWYDGYGDDSTSDDTAVPPVGANGFNAGVPGPIYQASPAPAHAGRAFIFRHGGGDTKWPRLIRIRYRIADRAGRVADADGNPGRIFEQIIRVPQ